MTGVPSLPPLSQWLGKALIALLGLLVVHAHSRNLEWTYEKQTDWGRDFRSCLGRYQSPINIYSEAAVEDLQSGSLIFSQGYMVEPDASTVLNNGHTAMVSVRVKGKAAVWGGPLPPGRFKFEQLHFHWGKNDLLGSEHTLDGRRFPLELHLVHYNDAYRSFQKALGKKDGILVLAVWFGLNNNSKTSALRPIVSSLTGTLDMGDARKIKKLNRLFDFLPRNKGSYFYYTGSLTTPPCTENVLWVVYAAPQGVTSAQMRAFRRLRAHTSRSDREVSLNSNFRYLQPLHQRKVHKVTRPADHDRIDFS